MKCYRLLPIVVCLGIASGAYAQTLWSDVPKEAAQAYTTKFQKDVLPGNFRLIRLDQSMSKQVQAAVPLENLAQPNAVSSTQFPIPLPDGSTLESVVIESPILSPELQQQNPFLKTYELRDSKTKNLLGRITIDKTGLSGIVFTAKGTVYINPLGSSLPDVHMVYYVRDLKVTNPVMCEMKESISNLAPTGITAGDCQRRTFRLAVAATGEYTTWAGSQVNALTYITTTVNNITAIYERDATVRFTLVTNNNIIFTNSATDPYATVAFPTSAGTLASNQTTLNNVAFLGSANYDLGIVINNGWNGGLASLSVVCNNSFKGRGAAGLTFGTGANPTPGPQGPIFDNVVAHELGHEFSATHTFIATNGGCTGNPTPLTAYEPGGGSSLMAYAGTCTGNSYQNNTDAYFHAGSIAQIQAFITGGGASCITPAAIANTAPTVTVTASAYTIPISTPFLLKSTGGDADGNTLSYSWEQMDAGDTVPTPPSPTSTLGPNFRSYPPSSNSSRTFPRIEDIAAGVSPTYEVLPSVARTMNFRVTARDNAAGGGCTAEANVAITTSGGSAFTVTSQAVPVTLTADGINTFTVTWNVAATNAAPFNSPNVNILFSVDGGITYPYTLVSGTPNDGTQTLTVPNLTTFVGRIKVESIGNVFFNVNIANITIQSSCAAEGSVFTPDITTSAPVGDASLNLALNPVYGSVVTPSGTLTSAAPAGALAVNNISVGNCIAFGNTYQYASYTFTPSVQGNYTFSRGGGTPNTLIFNLYNGTTFDGSNPCSNFVISNGTYNGVSVSPAASFTVALTPGLFYTLTIGTFNSGTPALPAAYTINVTPPGGGNIYTTTPPPGGSFNYTFVIVNNATGNIVAIDAGADLSNGGTFPAGTTYSVYGLSYLNTFSLAGYVGGPFTTLYNDLLNLPGSACGNVSQNSAQVNILSATTPVTFLGLTASKAGNVVLLSWKTATEQNNHHFDIERSADGSQFNTVLGSVPSPGNSNTIREYHFTDNSPLAAWNYYRVRQVDYDGKSSLTNIAAVQFDANSLFVQVYPNPARNSITVQYGARTSGKVLLSVVDGKGATVKETSLVARTGTNVVNVDISRLGAGIYLLKTTMPGYTRVTRFVKQ